MNKSRATILLLVSITAAMLAYGSCAAAADSDYLLRKDGSVRAGGQVFSRLQDFHRSEYFKDHGLRCGTTKSMDKEDSPLEKSISHCTSQLTVIQNEYWPAEQYEVPIWWHVITNTNGDGYVSNAEINAQMKALNEDFRAISGTMGAKGFDVKIQFVVAGIGRHTNNSWYGTSDDYSYKSQLQKDRHKYVNIYTNDIPGGTLGYAYFPQDILAGNVPSYNDGIVLNYAYVGGRNNGAGEYDQGRTLVHEMGHFLGLYHTFEGGDCFNSYATGDRIVDTNAEAAPNFTECVSASSCGSADPIHNYMDYSFDSCMWEFTREQANRAVCSMVNFRPDIYSVATDPAEPGVAVTPFIMPLILDN